VATATQLKALASYAAARARLAAAETALADALAAGGPAAVKQVEKAKQARAAAIKAMTKARSIALGHGGGFDLLSPRHPLLLLPVRLETRFAWPDGHGGFSFGPVAGVLRSLLVRIYPDDVHDDGHQPELTDNELQALIDLQKALMAARDVPQLDTAWTQAIRRVGPTRAGWLGEIIAHRASLAHRPGPASRPTTARLLPDRWIAIAELDDGSIVSARSALVQEPLETGPLPDGMAWMTDFETAVTAGMALVVPDLPDTLAEVRRLVVLGARATLGPAESAAELGSLLEAQHYTRGLALMGPGTPTNSLPGARAGYTSRPAPADVVPIERRRFMIGMRPQPLCQPGDESDGTALARALGIGVDTFAYVSHADFTEGQDGAELRSLLADATRARLTALLDDILDPGEVSMLLDFAVQFGSAGGPWPVLRVGSQPYGVLPILLRDDERPPDPGTFAAEALPMLDRLRATWSAAAAGIPWVGEPGDNAGETLIRILQRDGVARRIAFRAMLGPQLGDEVAAGFGGRSHIGRQRATAAAAIEGLGAADPTGSGLLHALHVSFAPELQAPVVEPADAAAGSPQLASQYLELVAATQPDRLLRHDYGGAERPRSLLFALVRLALLSRADDHARSVLMGDGEDPSHWDDERIVPGNPYVTPLGRLEATDPIDGVESIAFELSELGRDVAVLSDVRQILRRLATRPPELLEELVRSSLGLFSHRLDPWYTGFAVERLLELRNDPQTATGMCVGGFGVVERIRMSPRHASNTQADLFTSPVNGGYIHAPSVNHGAAAAVLRSVHLAHSSLGHGEAFSVDVSSERVRRALELLDGIRAGQPLAALLGYRIERGLAGAGLQRLTAGVRAAAPLLAHKLTPGTEPAEKVAASNVVDGLTLLVDAGYHGDGPPSAKVLLAHHPELTPLPTSDRNQLDRVLRAAADALDALSDLALSESVFQTVQGSPARAGAAVDALAGTAQAGDPDVVRTPRTGVGVTHRLLVLLGDSAAAVDGWAASPRAVAEPRLDAWAQAWLPPPDQIGVRVRFVDDSGGVVAQLDELTLADLHHEALDQGREDLPLGALDLVAAAKPGATAQLSPFELRLLALADLQRPADAEAAQIGLVFDRQEDWDTTVFGVPETLEIASALRDVIGRSRPLAPTDLASSGWPPATAVATGELAGRAAAAANALQTAIASLQAAGTGDDTTALRQALFEADRFGIPGAAPVTSRDATGDTHAAADVRAGELAGLRHQADAAAAEMERRVDTAGQAAGDSVAALVALFGEGFAVLPALSPATGATAPFEAAAAPDGFDTAAARTWLERAAPIRTPAGALNSALAYAEAVSAAQNDAAAATLRGGQLGGDAGERWVALPPAAGESIPGGRVSLVALTPGSDPPAGTLAGLFVDEWTEVVPSAQETTSVAFHLEAPSSAAPQTWLVGVPPAGREAWSEQDALQIVEEALALARLRLVDVDDVPALGQLLPALITAENPDGDAVGLDIEVLTREQL
jgi:hypothetical protein